MVKITEELVRRKSEHNECLISTLEELSLHQEDIERIEHLGNWSRDLKILLLQSNLISKIENLHKLKKLEYLNLAINNIERVENLEGLESLTKLDLTLNFIGELTSIECLRGNYNLRQLILTGNPCCDYPNYKEYVIATLPQLERVDGVEITTTEKLQAQKKLKDYREVIVQRQTAYAIERDEQKVRVQQQRQELEAKMASIEDETERRKCFWQAKSEHCPEVRCDISKYHREARPTDDARPKRPERKTPTLFAPCGRPYNLNQPKISFRFKDEPTEYILELDIYKFLDTSLITVDVEVNYVRVSVKGKIVQIAFQEEVKTSEAIVQRSQITGELVVTVPKLHVNEVLMPRANKRGDKGVNSPTTTDNKKSDGETLKDVVDIRNICTQFDDLPDLI